MKASFLGVAGMLITPLLILVGGGLGVSRRRRPRRDRGSAEDMTSCAG
jgi:hypothetical protein